MERRLGERVKAKCSAYQHKTKLHKAFVNHLVVFYKSLSDLKSLIDNQ